MTNKIANNFDVRINKPIDIRYTIKTLTEQVDISLRYLGLIFYTEDTKRLYIYADKISEAVLLSTFLERENQSGIVTVDYSNLLTIMKPFEKLGKIFTIFPLNVSYIFDGDKWSYFSGVYDVESIDEFNTIPKSLVGDKAKVIVKTPTEKSYITLANGELSDEIIELTNDDSDLINNRFYSKNGNLYYVIDGVLFNVGSRESILVQYNVINGINNVVHNLKSKNLSVSLVDESKNTITQVTYYKPIDENSIDFESYCVMDNVILIIKTL